MKQLTLDDLVSRYGDQFDIISESVPSVICQILWKCRMCGHQFQASVTRMRQRKMAGYNGCFSCDPSKPGRPNANLVGRVVTGFRVVEKNEDQYWCLCKSQHRVLVTHQKLIEKQPCCLECDKKRIPGLIGDPPIVNGKIHIIGYRFGKLVVVDEGDPIKKQSKSSDRVSGTKMHTKRMWKCLCDCGAYTIASTGKLQGGRRISCGSCGYITIGGEKLGSLLEAAIYLQFKQDGIDFLHNKEYPGFGRKRYDFYVPSSNKYIEVSSFQKDSCVWEAYCKRIAEKKAHVENNLKATFEFINRKCTLAERQLVFSKMSQPPISEI
jgi:hypothetical protein